MYVQGVDRVWDLNFNGRDDARKLTYNDVFQQAEQEYSRLQFRARRHGAAAQRISAMRSGSASRCWRRVPEQAADQHLMALPAYDQCIKASHIFNLLDARGVISVTERQSYILRVRELAKACCAAWLKTEGGR